MLFLNQENRACYLVIVQVVQQFVIKCGDS